MIKTFNANVVRSLVKELLILNRTEGAMRPILLTPNDWNSGSLNG